MAKSIDMVNGPLGRKIIRYALPLAATGFLQQLFNAADLAVVGRFAVDAAGQSIGTAAQAAVGSNGPIIGLLVNFFVGISLGSNVIIAQAIGHDDKDQIFKAVHTSVIVAVLGGLLLTLIGELAAGSIVDVLGVPEEALDMAATYLRIYFLGMPVILLYNFLSAIFRSCGNTRTPLVALALSGVVNVVLNLVFVIGFQRNVDGVAIATVISNLISATVLFVSLLRTDLPVKITPSKLRVDKGVLVRVLRIGVPSGVQSSLFSFSNIIVQSAVNGLGTVVMAASSAALNLEVFAYYVLNSFGQACTTFVGQNHGAGKNERCKRVLKLCLGQSFVATGISCAVVFALGRPLLGIFNQDSAVIDVGMIRLAYMFFAYLFSFAQEILSGYLRGFGISLLPAVCALVGICGTRLAWIFTVFRAHPTFTTIMRAYPISLAITAFAVFAATLWLRPSKRYPTQAV